MFSELYKLRIAEDEKTVIIHSGINKPSFYMPLGDTEQGINKVVDYCIQNKIKPVFTKIPESHVGLFESLKFKVKEDRNSFDYIFKNPDLAAYEGKDFRKQRNNLSSFYKECSPVYNEDIYNHIDACKSFTRDHYTEFDILNPTMRILDNIEHFNFLGGIVTCEDQIQAFCIYEKISDKVVLSHIELTNNAHRGAHAFLIKEMSSRIGEEYINKEDDMGLSGLRRFKESYNPCAMLKKYTACLI
jgi:hypothetical protein